MPAGWDHDKVILALVKRGEENASLKNVNIWVKLYPQQHKSALIYTKSSPFIEGREWEVYVKPDSNSFDVSKIKLNDQCLKKHADTSKGWSKYTVTDWDGFANMLGLTFGEDTGDDD